MGINLYICIYIYWYCLPLSAPRTDIILQMRHNDLNQTPPRASEQGSRKPISLPPVMAWYQGKDTYLQLNQGEKNMLNLITLYYQLFEIPRFFGGFFKKGTVSWFQSLTSVGCVKHRWIQKINITGFITSWLNVGRLLSRMPLRAS